MTIPAISAISSLMPTAATSATSLAGTAGTDAAASSGASSFASLLGQGLNAVSSAQSKADGLAIQAATGDLTNIHDYTIAATQASLVTELATAIRTKGVDAFNQIMGMQA